MFNEAKQYLTSKERERERERLNFNYARIKV